MWSQRLQRNCLWMSNSTEWEPDCCARNRAGRPSTTSSTISEKLEKCNWRSVWLGAVLREKTTNWSLRWMMILAVFNSVSSIGWRRSDHRPASPLVTRTRSWNQQHSLLQCQINIVLCRWQRDYQIMDAKNGSVWITASIIIPNITPPIASDILYIYSFHPIQSERPRNKQMN